LPWGWGWGAGCPEAWAAEADGAGAPVAGEWKEPAGGMEPCDRSESLTQQGRTYTVEACSERTHARDGYSVQRAARHRGGGDASHSCHTTVCACSATLVGCGCGCGCGSNSWTLHERRQDRVEQERGRRSQPTWTPTQSPRPRTTRSRCSRPMWMWIWVWMCMCLCMCMCMCMWTNGVCADAEGHSLALGDSRVMERRRWGRGSAPGDPRGPALPKPKGAVSPLPWGVVYMGLILCGAQRKVQHAHQSINWTWGLDGCVLRGSE
jgi:hypothetical protein